MRTSTTVCIRADNQTLLADYDRETLQATIHPYRITDPADLTELGHACLLLADMLTKDQAARAPQAPAAQKGATDAR